MLAVSTKTVNGRLEDRCGVEQSDVISCSLCYDPSSRDFIIESDITCMVRNDIGDFRTQIRRARRRKRTKYLLMQ